MESNKACPECRATWNGNVADTFKVVPADIFEEEEAENNVYRDSSKTKMVLNVLRKCLFNTAMPTESPT